MTPEEEAKKPSLQEIRDQVEAKAREEEQTLEAEKKPGKGKKKKNDKGGPDDPEFVMECLRNNERGDGVLFASLHRDRLVFDKCGDQWLEFPKGGHHWQADLMGRAVIGVEDVALKYENIAGAASDEIASLRKKISEEEAKADQLQAQDDFESYSEAKRQIKNWGNAIGRLTVKRKALQRRVDRLRGQKGAKNALFWAHNIDNPLAVKGKDVFDKKPMLFACKNGVIDLETGKLRPGSPQDWLAMASPIEFPEGVDEYLRTGNNCPCPTFEANQLEILGDEEVAAFWHRLWGYTLTGLVREHIITVAIGEGRNGKGTTFELFQNILGDFAWVISPELILEQKNARSSAGAAADIVALTNRRLIVGAEIDDNRRISGAAVKGYTGGDVIKARAPYATEEIQIYPTWKLFLHANYVPKGLTNDFALIQRLMYVNFPFSFVDDIEAEKKKQPARAEFFKQKDRSLPEKLAREAPGILAWMVRGCLLWQKEGLNPPASIKAAVDQLRQDEDTVGQFVDGRCIADEKAECLLKEFYEEFSTWYQANVGDRVPSRKWVATQLVKKGYGKDKLGGNIRIYGLRVALDAEP